MKSVTETTTNKTKQKAKKTKTAKSYCSTAVY